MCELLHLGLAGHLLLTKASPIQVFGDFCWRLLANPAAGVRVELLDLPVGNGLSPSIAKNRRLANNKFDQKPDL